jgi:hypothetical protein
MTNEKYASLIDLIIVVCIIIIAITNVILVIKG